MTYIVLAIYLIILAFIAIKSFPKVENYSDFFVARKRGNYFTITGSLVATILGGSAIIGAVDEGMRIGRAASWFMICASIGLFALVPLTARVNRMGKYTLPGLLSDMYNIQAGKFASYIIPVAWLGIIAAQIIAAARVLNSFTSLPYEAGAVISGMVFIIYTMAGGQVSVLKTDLFQSIVVLAGLGIAGFFTWQNKCIVMTSEALPDFPFNSGFRPLDLFVLLITYSTTFTAGPDIYSRIFCTNDRKIAVKSVFTAAIILLPVAFIIGLISDYGSSCLTILPSGSAFVAVCNSVLPSWAVAFIGVALLSALLSSADTTILSASIIITGLLEKESFGKRSLKKTRLIILIIGILSIIIALNFTSVIGILLIALTIYSGAFIVPILFGLTGIKVHKERAIMAMITGGVIALTGKIIFYAGAPDMGNIVIISAFVINGVILVIGRRGGSMV